MPSAAPTAYSSAVSVAYRPLTEASPSSAAAATSSSRTSSQTIALGVRAAFGDTPSATVGESWYGAHTTLSNQAGRRRAAFCYPTNAAVLMIASRTGRPTQALDTSVRRNRVAQVAYLLLYEPRRIGRSLFISGECA